MGQGLRRTARRYSSNLCPACRGGCGQLCRKRVLSRFLALDGRGGYSLLSRQSGPELRSDYTLEGLILLILDGFRGTCQWGLPAPASEEGLA